MVWNLLNQIFVQVISLGVFLILARELSPAAFGLFALALLITDAFAIEARSALTDVLLMRRDFSKAALTAVIVAGGLGASGVWIVISLSAGPVADLVDTPSLAALLPWLALGVLLAPAQAVYEALALKDFAFKELAARGIAANLVGAGGALLAVWAGLGVFALVVQRLASGAVTLLLTVRISGWSPSRAPHLALARPFARPFAKLWLGQMTNFASGRAVDLIIGLKLGTGGLGLFRVASRVLELVQTLATRPLIGVYLPVLGQSAVGSPEQRRQFLEISSVAALLAAPAFAGLAAVAPELVRSILDPRYAQAGEVLRLLALAGLTAPVLALRSVTLTAAGRPGLAARLAALEFVVLSSLVYVGAAFSLIYATGGLLLSTWLMALVSGRLILRSVGVSIAELSAQLAPPYLGAALMTGVVFVVRIWLGDLLTVPVLLAALVGSGALAFSAYLFAAHRRWARERFGYLRAGRGEPLG